METNNTEKKDKIEHQLFDASILLKALHAVVEIAGGVFTFVVSPHFVFKVLNAITLGELTEDPTDSFAHYLLKISQNFSVGTKQFVALYLLSHGIVNLVIVIGLFKKKLWAYYASFVALTIFALYQIYRYFHNHSVWLIVLTFFDIAVIWLIWKEYKRVRKTAISSPLH